MLKRFLDIFASLCVIVFFLPLYLFLAYQIRRKIGSPIIFQQVRPGLHGKPFKLIKFRTMSNLLDADGKLLPDEQRMTRFGIFLRATSLDELPEFWNVLKGDMSLVGPRPLLQEYMPLYTKEQHRRHDVRPGITGWAQINGRNNASWDMKLKYDVWYVDHLSFLLDIKVLFITLKKVFLREGICSNGHVTTEKFKGTDACDV